MKKIILLLILPLSLLMAIDFTMTKDGLFAQTTTPSITPSPAPSTEPETSNPYLEPVNLPKCDANNPEVQFIRNNADWSKINSSKRIFCVSPGDYRSLGSIKLTTSGTATKRRYIVLNNGNDTHPGKLNTDELAIFDLLIDGADYWTIDRYYANRAGGADTQGGYNVRFKNGASYNIFNRGYMTHFGSLIIFDLCHNNTVQNSRFSEQNDPGYDGGVAVQIAAWGAKFGQIHNTKVINNEFYNCNDGFQIVRRPLNDGTGKYQDFNAEGTILDSNKFYKDVPYMENAFDLQAGSKNQSNPIIISNNIMEGYKRHPDYVPGPYPAGQSAIMLHYEPHYVRIYDNVFFDCAKSIDTGAGTQSFGFPYAVSESKIYNNIMASCGDKKYGLHPIHASSIRNADFHDNYIINPRNKVAYLHSNKTNSFFRNTKVVNPFNGVIEFFVRDGFQNDAQFTTSMGTTVEVDGSAYTDFVYIRDAFTNSPQTITYAKILDPNGSIVSPK